MSALSKGASATAIAAAAAALALAGSAVSAGEIPQAGSPAPAFTMPLVANGTGAVSLSSYRGHPVYLNFFASWCGPCKAELPSIVSLSKTYAKKGVIVLGIDELESPGAAVSFAKAFGVQYPVGVDSSGSIGAAYGLIGMPMHVFIGADGKIALRRPGEMSGDQIGAELAVIAKR